MRTATTRIEPWKRRSAIVFAACCWLALMPPPAGAQNNAQDSAPPPASIEPPPPPAPPPPKAGLFEAIGRWVDRSTTQFSNHLRGAKRSMDDLGDKASANSKEMTDQAARVGQGAADIGKNAVDATKNAVDAVAKLPAARMISGRERCALAPNGAPDCVTAAEALCRKKGFSTGKSMDFTSAEECPVKTLVGESDQCTTVTFISRAMCQ